LKIDLATSWWSTRLFLLAILTERFTQVRRILIIDTTSDIQKAVAKTQPPGAPSPPAPNVTKSTVIQETFIGQIATGAILAIIGPKLSQLAKFQNWIRARPIVYNDLSAEVETSVGEWERFFGDAPYTPIHEGTLKTEVTTELLRRWFKDTMFHQPLRIADLQRASVVDLLRLLDYPNDYVPVLTRHIPEEEGDPVFERVDIMDKAALNRRLARSYLVELMDRARLSQVR
jgi:hypothetical protein